MKKVQNIDNVVMPEKLRQILMQLNTIPVEVLEKMTLQEKRDAYERFALTHGGPLLSITRIEDTEVLSPEGHKIRIRIYTPCFGKILPVLMYIHGGGWIRGSLSTHDSICRRLANIGNCLVVSLEWRLAPEQPFPAGFYDAQAVYSWIIHNIKSYSGDTKRIAIGGDSAGANLAASLTNFLKNAGLQLPCFQLLIYPCVSLKMQTPSYQEFTKGFLLTSDYVKNCIEAYIRDKKDLDNPQVNPILEANFSGLPPTHIVTAEYDPLRDEGKLYFEYIQKANVPSTYMCATQMVHAFLHLTGSVREAEDYATNIGETLRKNLYSTDIKTG